MPSRGLQLAGDHLESERVPIQAPRRLILLGNICRRTSFNRPRCQVERFEVSLRTGASLRPFPLFTAASLRLAWTGRGTRFRQHVSGYEARVWTMSHLGRGFGLSVCPHASGCKVIPTTSERI